MNSCFEFHYSKHPITTKTNGSFLQKRKIVRTKAVLALRLSNEGEVLSQKLDPLISISKASTPYVMIPEIFPEKLRGHVSVFQKMRLSSQLKTVLSRLIGSQPYKRYRRKSQNEKFHSTNPPPQSRTINRYKMNLKLEEYPKKLTNFLHRSALKSNDEVGIMGVDTKSTCPFISSLDNRTQTGGVLKQLTANVICCITSTL